MIPMGLSKQVRLVSQDRPVPGQDIADVAVFDQDGNPVELATKADVAAYDPVVVANGEPAIGGRTGQDYIDADTGDLYTYGPADDTNENTEDNPTK